MSNALNTKKIAIIGCGSMGECLVKGLIDSGFPSNQIIVTRRQQRALENLFVRYGVVSLSNNQDAMCEADIILLSVKPQQFEAMAQNIRIEAFEKNKVIVSVMSGITIDKIKRCLFDTNEIFRAMPNTPALIQQGVTALYTNELNSSNLASIEQLFMTVGKTVWLQSEEQINIATALSGSGPAYYFSFMQALEAQAIALGLPQQTARILNETTAMGSIKLVNQSKDDFATLIKKVTSPGGTTEAALKVFAENNFDKIVQQAVNNAHQRARELG